VADETVTVKVTDWPNVLDVGEAEIVSEVPVSACAALNEANNIALASAHAPTIRGVLARTRDRANRYPRSARAKAAREICQIAFT
jgi:hypothetical protein